MTAPADSAPRCRAGLALALLLAVALPLLGCGKKADPGAPPGVVSTYPRVYPHD